VLAARHRGVVLLLLVVALLVAPTFAQADTCTPDASWGTIDRGAAQQVAVQLNQARAANGLGPLQLSPTLTASAEWKSLDMGFYNYFDHSDPAPPVARSAGQRMSDCGYPYGYDGENIAEGFSTPSDVMDAWMNSAGHRANILNGQYAVMGVGVGITARGIYYWTVDFGGTADAGTVPVGSSPTPPAPTTSPPPPPPAPVTTAPAPVVTTPVAPPVTTVRSTTAATTTAPADPSATSSSGTLSSKDAATAIGTPVASTSQLVAAPDTFHARPGRPRILHPLGNDQNPSGKPLRIVRILEKPHGSSARVVRHGHAIRLRLPHAAHGVDRLVYLVRTDAGELAAGVITVITRHL
jgi:uncharacterized protein YkwD